MRRTLDILYNFHWIVSGEAARGAQAYAGMLRQLLRFNRIATLINLRGHNPAFGWWHYETRICHAMGVHHMDVMLDSRKLPTRTMLVALFDAFDAAPKPFLIKCSGGQDRTSLAAALYLVHRDGWAAEARAMLQFSRWPYLHFPKPHQRWLRTFLRFAREEAKGKPIADWARTDYGPHRLAAWLNDNGHAGSYREIFTRPEASRWQW